MLLSTGQTVPPRRARLVALLAVASLAAWAGCGSSSSPTTPFAFTPSMLAGTWTYADQQTDTISVTIAVTDTVLSGSGWVTSAQLRALSGGVVTEVPITITGWVSPGQRKLHLDATVTDATHLAATWTVTVNGAVFWSQTTITTISKS